MEINSLEYLLFAALACGVYFIAPKKIKWIVLLLASYIYYFICSGTLAVFLMITTLSIYLLGLGINKIDEKTKAQCKKVEKEEKKKIKKKPQKNKKWLIAIAVIINFGILAILNYGNFLGENINAILNLVHVKVQIPKFNFVLPLGISYYTLQAISYVVDVYRGKYKADKNLGKVALFLSFFPQMVEGPIGRYDDLADQLYEPHSFNYKNVKFGMQLMLWGFFKKMVIADRAALYVNTVFADYSQYSGLIVIIAVILYTVQIYAEFSGCMDIVRGIAHVIGIEMAENFRRPFFSKSVQEFWRRWHITLGTWLKDYVFYPVSFSNACINLTATVKKFCKNYISKLIPAAFALFFVWFGNGIWHGASWKYIFYGLYYYIIMMLGMLFEPLFKFIIEKLKINIESWWYKLIQMIRTTIFVLIGMLIFRSHRLLSAWQMFKSIFNFTSIKTMWNEQLFNLGLTKGDFIVVIIGIVMMLVVGIIQERGKNIREEISKKPIIIRWALYYIMIFAIVIFGIYGPGYAASSFIYGQF